MSNKLPYGIINDSLKTIAEKVSATVPEKRYANEKDEIAGTLDAISNADISGGGGSGIMKVTFTATQVQGDYGTYTEFSVDKTYAEILAYYQNGGIVIGVVDGDVGVGSGVCAGAELLLGTVGAHAYGGDYHVFMGTDIFLGDGTGTGTYSMYGLMLDDQNHLSEVSKNLR